MTDGTSNFTQNGKVSFFPPVDWAKTKVSTDPFNEYYIRATSTTVTTIPIESTIWCEDFVPVTGGRMYEKGWDPANDVDGDGFVSDAEFASLVNPLATARFAYQSRVPYGNSAAYVGNRWTLNVNNSNTATWGQQWFPSLKTSQGSKDDGIFSDNGYLYIDWASANWFREFAANSTWYTWNGIAWGLLKTALGSTPFNVNVGNNYNNTTINTYGTGPDVLETESWLTGYTSIFKGHMDDIINRSKVLGISSMLEGLVNPQVAMDADRNKIYSLASYYLQAYDTPYAPTYFYYGGAGYRASDNRTVNWFKAIEYNVGTPTGDYYTAQTGYDPEKTSIAYTVFCRSYTNALVCVKPMIYGLYSGTWQFGTTDDGTLTSLSLGGSYQPLNYDGTLGSVATTVSLRNQEGTIMIPADSSGSGSGRLRK